MHRLWTLFVVLAWSPLSLCIGFGHSLLSLRGRHCPYASALDTLCCPCVVATVLMHRLWTLFVVLAWSPLSLCIGFGHSLLSLRGRHCPYAWALDTLHCLSLCGRHCPYTQALDTVHCLCLRGRPCTVLIHRERLYTANATVSSEVGVCWDGDRCESF